MLRAFLERHDVMCRLLEYRDGERRVTNLLHLAERLHCQGETRGVGGLIAWLAAKRSAPGSGDEEELLRLESDENLVKILTVHVAKGLEFPLVFCPFLWDGGLRSAKDDPVAFHDPSGACRPALEFGSDAGSSARVQAMREERAESLRLLYVALTRAKYRCWMVWGHINEAETSAPAWLFHPGRAKLDPKTMRADLERLAASSEGTIRVSDLEPAKSVPFAAADRSRSKLEARSFDRPLLDSRRVTSFTGLAHDRAIEAPDYDAADRPEAPELATGRRNIFAFPRGAHAGKCLHAIFEHVDFERCARPELERIVARDLVLHGFDDEWTGTVADMMEAVLATPLDRERTLRLSGVSRARRLDELEFYYPIAELSGRGVRDVLLAWGFPDEIRQRIGALTFSTKQGYMRGFIDLVFEHDGRFYLADYKSNWLGATRDAYRRPQLEKAMGREAYYLQYLVYCVALHRYLAVRVAGYRYERHFGGVRYLFLRGMRPETGIECGVYADLPAEGLIRELDDYLGSGAPKRRPRRPVQSAFDFR
jgi:exodeoxyribonuclease V beta subunit